MLHILQGKDKSIIYIYIFDDINGCKMIIAKEQQPVKDHSEAYLDHMPPPSLSSAS